MADYLLECSMLVRRPLTDVFAVFESPYNLARITPPWLRFHIVSKEKIVMRPGVKIDYTIRWMGLPMAWRTLITAYEPPHRFIDEQERGPYALWRHTHSFEETPEGVLVGDRVEYAMPLGPLGRLANAAMVRHQLLAIFRYRQKSLAAMFDVPLLERVAPRIVRPGR